MRAKFSLLTLLAFSIQFVNCSNSKNESLRLQIHGILEDFNGTIGIAIKNLDTGDSLSFNNDLHYPMQSVYKFPLAMAVLKQIDIGNLHLNQTLHISKNDLLPNTWSPLRDKYPGGNVDIPLSEVISFTVSQSDNNGCDILFRLLGGTKNIEDYIHSLGVKNIAIVGTEEEMHADWTVQFRNWSQPSALIELLYILYQKKSLSESSSNYLLKLLTETSTGPNRIKGLLPAGTVVAHKTGSSGKGENGVTAALNDVGVIELPNGQSIAIAVFISNTKADEELSESVIAKISKATYDYFQNSK